MNTKKYISIIVVSLSVVLAITASAATTSQQGSGQYRGGQMPVVFGTVSAVNGDTITVTSKGFGQNATATTYTVDATNATVTKNNTAGTVSAIAVGDTVMVQGTVSGTSVTATAIRDGVAAGRTGNTTRGKSGTMTATKKPATAQQAGMGVIGTVASISGTTLTVTSNATSSGGTTTTYTVDASSATVTKDGSASSLSDIAVGDTVAVQGTVSGTNVTAKTIRDGVSQQAMQGNGQPVVAGSVTAISGDTITITNKSNVTYTVDATNATFSVKGVASPTIANVAVGDNLTVQGTVSGNNVTASSIIDQPATAGSTSNNQQSTDLIGNVVSGVTNFFKHLFGF